MTTGESTCTCCSPVRTVMRSRVVTPWATGCGDATGWTLLPTQATATPATSSATPVRCMDERDMAGLEEGECLWYSRLQRRGQAAYTNLPPKTKSSHHPTRDVVP